MEKDKESIPFDHAKDSPAGTFVRKLFNMVENETNDVITWINNGSAFHIKDTKRLSDYHLPKYFRHGKFSSLIRQLNFYSFYKVQDGTAIIYRHSFFRQGRPDLLVNIKRRGAGKAKDPLYDPVGNSVATTPSNVPLKAPGISSSILNRMSPSNKISNIPESFPPPMNLDAVSHNDSHTKRVVRRKAFEKYHRIKKSKHTHNFESSISFDSIFVDNYHFGDTLVESSELGKFSNVSLISRESMKWSDISSLSSDAAKKENTIIDLDLDVPQQSNLELSSEDLLMERPLSPLNLPDQTTFLDMAF